MTVMERLNARYPFPLPEPVGPGHRGTSPSSPSPACSLRRRSTWSANGAIVALVKPQFEAERGEVGRGGVIRKAAIHARVLGRVMLWAIAHRFRLRGLTPSPILGDAGNREFFLLLTRA